MPVVSAIGLDGKMNSHADQLAGMNILDARTKAVAILQEKGLIEKIDASYKNLVPVDYRSGDYVENLVLPNWFIKVKDIKEPAYEVVKQREVTIYPKWRTNTYLRWMEGMYDWAISRQVVWGIRIPAWYDVDKNPAITVKFLTSNGDSVVGEVGDLLKKYTFNEISDGLQSLIAPQSAEYEVSQTCPGDNYLQETDTFDTWFSSGQWPLVTLGYPDSDDFKYFYPTSVLETGWEIVTRWVSRMMMFGMYATRSEEQPNGIVPFKDIYLHGIVKARDGKKMSKSLGNVINPEEYISEYGVDALRMGLIAGTANGKDFSFPHDKVLAYRNFANKVWNMTRFMQIIFERYEQDNGMPVAHFTGAQRDKINAELTELDQKMLKKLDDLITVVDKWLEKYNFALAGEEIYHFMWDDLASTYIEDVKTRDTKEAVLSVLRHIHVNCLKLLHPFMPFVTEKLWSEVPGISELKEGNAPLIIAPWPTTNA